jgi:hypothetical protein
VPSDKRRVRPARHGQGKRKRLRSRRGEKTTLCHTIMAPGSDTVFGPALQPWGKSRIASGFASKGRRQSSSRQRPLQTGWPAGAGIERQRPTGRATDATHADRRRDSVCPLDRQFRTGVACSPRRAAGSF